MSRAKILRTRPPAAVATNTMNHIQSFTVLLRAAAAALALGGVLAAQTCNGPSSVFFANSGATCDFFGQPATMSGNYDVRTCTLTLTQSIPTTCCNTIPTMTFLLIGATQLLPGVTSSVLVPGCEIGVIPFAVVPGPAIGTSQSVDFVLPAPMTPFTIHAQGINQFFTTIGGSTDLQSTDVLSVTIV